VGTILSPLNTLHIASYFELTMAYGCLFAVVLFFLLFVLPFRPPGETAEQTTFKAGSIRANEA